MGQQKQYVLYGIQRKGNLIHVILRISNIHFTLSVNCVEIQLKMSSNKCWQGFFFYVYLVHAIKRTTTTTRKKNIIETVVVGATWRCSQTLDSSTYAVEKKKVEKKGTTHPHIPTDTIHFTSETYDDVCVCVV